MDREAMDKSKGISLLLCAVLAVLLCFGIEAAVLLSQDLNSRRQARAAAESFVEAMEQVVHAEEQRLQAMAESTRSGLALAMEKKQEKQEELALLLLVNPWNPVPDGYEPQLEAINDSHAVDVRCADALRQMLADCALSGASPLICSSYRTQEMQEELYDNKMGRLLAEGYPPAEVPAIAARSVAIPGTSEHQLGLAVDIIHEFYPYLNYTQEYTMTQQWLLENCWNYGFILRYPNGTTDVTGIIYEPWHYRYVGVEAAQELRELGIPFEEYLQLRRGR